VSSLPDLIDSTIGERVGGRGVSLMLTFMDEVNYNDVGNEVTMIKYRDEIGARLRSTAAGAGK
jgi:anti-sigma regulatory factor (Ser/Thr protein kinase)